MMEEIILKYLREEATEIEKAQLAEWLRQQEANRQQFMQLRDLWLAATPIPHAGPDYAEQAFQRFMQATKKLESKGLKNASSGLYR
ncbi:MAG: hypothetical protein LIO97_09845 [Tannerellaceae bacterium]|nr:hypothetical protein [Tannerellaceae bacterium]